MLKRAYHFARNTSMLSRICESHSELDLKLYISTLQGHEWGDWVLTKLCNEQFIPGVDLPLIVCVKNGSLGLAKILLTMLSGKIDVNARDWGGFPAIYYAVALDRFEFVELLIEHGARVNIEVPGQESTESVLMVACRKGHNDCVDTLLKHEVFLNYRNSKGQTALLEAARFGRHTTIQSFLAAAPAAEMTLAIETARKHGRYKCVDIMEQMLESDLDVEDERNIHLKLKMDEFSKSKSRSWRSRRSIVTLPNRFLGGARTFWRVPSSLVAARKGDLACMLTATNLKVSKEAVIASIDQNDLEIAEVLLARFVESAPRKPNVWLSLMKQAVRSGAHSSLVLLCQLVQEELSEAEARGVFRKCLEFCIKEGRPRMFQHVLPLSDDRIEYAGEFLELCAPLGRHEIALCILQTTQDINQLILPRCISIAQEHGHEEFVVCMMKNCPQLGELINTTVIGDFPVFVHACKLGLLTVLKAYLENPAVDPNVSDEASQRTGLMSTANYEAIAMLLDESRVRLEQQDFLGHTFAQLLVQAQHGRRNPREVNRNPFGECLPDFKCKVLKKLLATERFDINQVANDGTTPVWHKCEELSMLKLFVAEKALDINKKGDRERAFLYTCILETKFDKSWFDAVIDREDIDVNTSDDTGWNPLCLACRYGEEGIVLRLLSHDDIDVNWKKNDGWTPLMLAAANGYGRIVNLLMSYYPKSINIKTLTENDETAFSLALRYRRDDVAELLSRQGSTSRKRVIS